MKDKKNLQNTQKGFLLNCATDLTATIEFKKLRKPDHLQNMSEKVFFEGIEIIGMAGK